MNNIDAEKSINNNKYLHFFFICVILLLGVGIVTLYSTSFSFSQKNFLKQIIIAAVSFILFIGCSYIKLEILRKFIIPLVCLSFLLFILSWIPNIGEEKGGATRWIKVGKFITYQPSEMVKFVLPLYLAHLFDRKADKINNFITGFLPPMIVAGLFFMVIIIQNNFSTGILIFCNVIVIFFLAGMHYRYFLAILIMMLPVSSLIVFSKEHRVKRLISYLRPEWDPLGSGFQPKASRYAIISGGMFGKGLGEGTYKIESIPEIHADFIFSAYAEETGFFGIIIFFVLIAMFSFLGYKAAFESESIFGRLLAAGLTTAILSQALLNTAVVSGMLPVTGIPLPFFSAGGSSIITTLISAGLIMNVARKKGTNAGSQPISNNYNVTEANDVV